MLRHEIRMSVSPRPIETGDVGLVTARLILSNPRNPSSEPVEVPALADTGSVFLCIPEHVRLQLGLETLQEREVALADGSCISVPYVGPIVVRFKNRIGVMGALVLGTEVLLGAIPMEDMDLVVDPRRQIVDVNPASPNIASGIVKSAAYSSANVYSCPGGLSSSVPDITATYCLPSSS